MWLYERRWPKSLSPPGNAYGPAGFPAGLVLGYRVRCLYVVLGWLRFLALFLFDVSDVDVCKFVKVNLVDR